MIRIHDLVLKAIEDKELLEELTLDRIVPSLITTDTDSFYISFLGIFRDECPLVTEEQYAARIREHLIHSLPESFDTANLDQ